MPDLSERIQVSLFNLMQERDVQIKGYRIMLPLDVMLVSSANPEDYTNRGRIITPLKDRYGAQIRTHYPRDISQEIEIMEQEHTRFDDSADAVEVPQYMKEVVAGDHQPGAAQPGDKPALRRQPARIHRQLRDDYR